MTDAPGIDWYQSLAKPSWTLAPRTIGLIWQILYPVIISTFGFVFIQAGLGRLPLAAMDILVVWSTIVWMMLAIWLHHRWVAVAQVPCFVWVSIATVLQLSITWMNRG